jgi:purine-binding chemotaxis protein CheW
MATDEKRNLGGKYLTFVLGDEEYGLDALKVEGILSLQPITPIPNAPYYFKGVVTVRGQVAPIISARAKLGMPEIEDTPATCIILVRLDNSSWAGLIVDTVRDVIDISSAEIEPPPSLGNFGDNEVIGLAKSGDKVKILIDVEVTLADVAQYAKG